jgi:hypothetical protein
MSDAVSLPPCGKNKMLKRIFGLEKGGGTGQKGDYIMKNFTTRGLHVLFLRKSVMMTCSMLWEQTVIQKVTSSWFSV